MDLPTFYHAEQALKSSNYRYVSHQDGVYWYRTMFGTVVCLVAVLVGRCWRASYHAA